MLPVVSHSITSPADYETISNRVIDYVKQYLSTALCDEYAFRTIYNGNVDIHVFKTINYRAAFDFTDALFKDYNVLKGYEALREQVLANTQGLQQRMAREPILLVSRQFAVPMAILLLPVPYFTELCELRVAICGKYENINQSREFILTDLGISHFSEL